MISSEPEKYPLERGIVPLVYELKRLDVFQPCWSCEGHDGADGELWKSPRVWFYSGSVVHLRLLATTIETLHLEGHLNTPWRVALTFSDNDNPDTTFSLEPEIEQPPPPLASLRQDIELIAAHLHDGYLASARKLSAILD